MSTSLLCWHPFFSGRLNLGSVQTTHSRQKKKPVGVSSPRGLKKEWPATCSPMLVEQILRRLSCPRVSIHGRTKRRRLATETALLVEVVVVANWGGVAGVATPKPAIEKAVFRQLAAGLQIVGVVVVFELTDGVFVAHPRIVLKAH